MDQSEEEKVKISQCKAVWTYAIGVVLGLLELDPIVALEAKDVEVPGDAADGQQVAVR